MCGRYSLLTPPNQPADALGLLNVRFDGLAEFLPRYDVRPGSDCPVLVETDRGRSIQNFRWGLVPSWAEESKIGYRMINARSETVAVKPSFRSLLPRRRCLVPADGFYEWMGEKGAKERHWIFLQNRQPFFMAGLWDRWRSADGQSLFTFTILTTRANELVAPIHDRMPVILASESAEIWLDRQSPVDVLEPLYEPTPSTEMDTQTVANDLSDIVPDGWSE